MAVPYLRHPEYRYVLKARTGTILVPPKGLCTLRAPATSRSPPSKCRVGRYPRYEADTRTSILVPKKLVEALPCLGFVTGRLSRV